MVGDRFGPAKLIKAGSLTPRHYDAGRRRRGPVEPVDLDSIKNAYIKRVVKEYRFLYSRRKYYYIGYFVLLPLLVTLGSFIWYLFPPYSLILGPLTLLVGILIGIHSNQKCLKILTLRKAVIRAEEDGHI